MSMQANFDEATQYQQQALDLRLTLAIKNPSNAAATSLVSMPKDGTLNAARQTYQEFGIGRSPLAQSWKHIMWNRSIYFELVIAVHVALLLSAASDPRQTLLAQDQNTTESEKYEGKTIDEWIANWDGNFNDAQLAQKALAKIGAPAVPSLSRLVEENHRHAGYAIKTLAAMGEAAKPALPILFKLGENKSAGVPDGWTWNVPIRAILFMSFAEMSWASNELVTLLEKVGADETETDQIRGMAVRSLGGMGKEALPVLRKFLMSANKNIRNHAAAAIVMIEKGVGKSESDARQEIIDLNPFDENVPDYLANMKGTFNHGSLHGPTQKIKKLYRSRLSEKPDAQIAWQLATIIRNGLAGTDIQWATPSDSYQSRWNREDPDESYMTLASALKIAFEHSEPDSELKKKAGLSLAKLSLLKGDWDAMNMYLVELGQRPIPNERRSSMPPPPLEWDNLERDWQPAKKEILEGTSTIEFRFLTHDERLLGVPGVHVLVKQRPKEAPAGIFFGGGISVDTLFHATQPMLEEPYESFGYRAQDREVCRYGFSNSIGQVRFERLPAGPYKIEILVPTSNFDASGQTWDLYVKTDAGAQIVDRRDPRSVPSDLPPYLVELQEGAVTKYPILYVHSHMIANVQDWDAVDKDFVLTWKAPSPADVDYYKVRLTLSAPMQDPDMVQSSPELVTETQDVNGNQWPIGAQGVGKLQLAPGNIYVIEVDAIRNDQVSFRLPRRRIWMPWHHRESQPPLHGMNSSHPAFYHDIWLRTNVNELSLEERLPKLIQESASLFETEYYRLGMAWLDLHKSKPNALDDLQQLTKELPAGNVVHATAQFLIDTHKAGKPNPNRLQFVPPPAVNGNR
jgi:hypothetical protein